MRKAFQHTFLALLFLWFGWQPGAAANLFSINMDDCDVRIINVADGLTEAVRLIQVAGVDFNCTTRASSGTGLGFGHGLATDPATGNLYAVVRLHGSNSHRLLKISPITGVVGPVISLGDSFDAIAFNTTGNILYGVTGESASVPETLFRIDKSNGNRTQVCTLGNGDTDETIAFQNEDNLIYHASGRQTKVFEKINPSTCQITNIGFFPPDFGVGTSALTDSGSNTFLFADFSALFDLSNTGRLTNNNYRFLDHGSKGLAFASGTIKLTDLALSGTCGRSGKDTLTERINIRNFSAIQSTGILLTSRLPAGITFVSDSLHACSVSGPLLSCQLGNIAAMGSVSFDIQYTVSFGRKTKVQQALRLSSNEFEKVQTFPNNFFSFNDSCH